MLSIDLPADLDGRLEALASRTGRTKNDHICEALANYLNDLEDLQVAEERFRELSEGKQGTTSLTELMKRWQ